MAQRLTANALRRTSLNQPFNKSTLEPFEKRDKILDALRQIDNKDTGMLKLSLFNNLLACMSFFIRHTDKQILLDRFTLDDQVFYERVMEILTFSFDKQVWIAKDANKLQKYKDQTENDALSTTNQIAGTSKKAEEQDGVSADAISIRSSRSVAKSIKSYKSVTLSNFFRTGAQYAAETKLGWADDEKFFNRKFKDWPNYSSKDYPGLKEGAERDNSEDQKSKVQKLQAQKLSRIQNVLLQAQGADKENLKTMIKVCKALHEENVDQRQLNQIYMTIIRDYFQATMQTQSKIETVLFRQLARQKIKIKGGEEQFEELINQLVNCIKLQNADVAQVSKSIQSQKEFFEGQDNDEFISMQKLHQLIELFNFLPKRVQSDQQTGKQIKSIFESNQLTKATSQPQETDQNLQNLIQNSDFSQPKASLEVRQGLKLLARLGLQKFDKVSHMFRSFCADPASGSVLKSHVTLADFKSKMQEIGLNLQEQVIIDIFNHLDEDKDGKLKYNDFVNLCQEAHSVLPQISQRSGRSGRSTSSQSQHGKESTTGNGANADMNKPGTGSGISNSFQTYTDNTARTHEVKEKAIAGDINSQRGIKSQLSQREPSQGGVEATPRRLNTPFVANTRQIVNNSLNDRANPAYQEQIWGKLQNLDVRVKSNLHPIKKRGQSRGDREVNGIYSQGDTISQRSGRSNMARRTLTILPREPKKDQKPINWEQVRPYALID